MRLVDKQIPVGGEFELAACAPARAATSSAKAHGPTQAAFSSAACFLGRCVACPVQIPYRNPSVPRLVLNDAWGVESSPGFDTTTCETESP